MHGVLSQLRNEPNVVQVKVSTDEIAAIDEFRFQTRMPNRATAIRELLRRGLGAPKTERG